MPRGGELRVEAIPALTSQPEISAEVGEDKSRPDYSGEDQPIVLDSEAAVQARCWLLDASEAYAHERTRDHSYPRVLSADEQKAMVAFEDPGFAALRDAEKLRWWLDTSPYAEQLRSEPFHERLEHPVMKAMQGTYLRAVRSHTRGAAFRLASLYRSSDRFEARAWLVIEREMGGSSLSERERSRGSFSPQTTDEFTEKEPTLGEFTEEEKLASEARAEELIIEHNLFHGLRVPEECLTDEEVEEQRSRLSGLARRLAERAMPSD